jgi:peroxiredoxin
MLDKRKEPEGEFFKPSLEPEDTAPDFVLPAAKQTDVSLSDTCKNNDLTVLVFYRGYW